MGKLKDVDFGFFFWLIVFIPYTILGNLLKGKFALLPNIPF